MAAGLSGRSGACAIQPQERHIPATGRKPFPFGDAPIPALVCRILDPGSSGIEAHELVRPELYAAPWVSIDYGFRRGDIHLIFSYRRNRILRGAYTCLCSVEFDQLMIARE